MAKMSKRLAKLVEQIARLRARANILAVWDVEQLLGQAVERTITYMRLALVEEQEDAVLGSEGMNGGE